MDAILVPIEPKALSDSQRQARKHLLSLAENVISLFWSLAETSQKTLEAVIAARVEPLLVKVLKERQVLGLGVALAAGEQ